ncbi:MAG: hypothetical protein LBI78_02605 [Campylobacteraceae bacterium]|jgi:YHS domain-containing protein|nr:hypothetical protein [Campylobacteraceae bacterium]
MINPDNSLYKERRIQYRDNENLLLKLNTYKLDDFEADLTAVYAPYTQTLFSAGSRDSDYDVKGGGLNIIYNMQNSLKFGTSKNTLSFKQTQTAQDNAKNLYYAWLSDPLGSTNWGNSRNNSVEGSRGNQQQSKMDFGLKSALYFDEIKTGDLEHDVKVGIETEFTKSKSKYDGSTYFYTPQKNASSSGNKENGVLSGEQWTKNKYEYIPHRKSKDYFTAALFLEDDISFERFTLRPGIRISTDSLTDNVDIAPRFFANADVFNDEILNIHGGYNRYYGTQILGYALYKFSTEGYSRNSWDDNWTYSVTYPSTYNIGDLKTPYSDEFSFGAAFNYRDILFKTDFVNRKYKNQIKTKYENSGGTFRYENTNDGKTDYWGLTFAASKDYAIKNTKHLSEFSATRSITKNNHIGFNSFASNSGTYSPTHVTYNGGLILTEELPSSQFNSPWVIAYAHFIHIDNLRLNTAFRYQQGGYGLKFISNTGLTDPNGLQTREYELKKYGDTFNVDLSANYDLNIKGNKLTFGVEILNILNRKNDASYTSSATAFTEEYSMGRQFYADLRYEF